MKTVAVLTVCALLSGTSAFAQDSSGAAGANVVADTPTAAAPSASPTTDCRKINKGGPIAGITVGAVFWPLLPLSIPLLVTQSKKLKRRNAELYEQSKRGCPPQ